METKHHDERDEFVRELDQDDGSFPESWKPRPGDKIVGRLVRYDRAESKFGPRWVAVLETRNNEGQRYLAGVWLSHIVLIDQFKRRLRPRLGERVGIKRLPDHEDKGYARYVLKVERQTSENVPDWDALDGLERSGEGETLSQNEADHGLPF